MRTFIKTSIVQDTQIDRLHPKIVFNFFKYSYVLLIL